ASVAHSRPAAMVAPPPAVAAAAAPSTEVDAEELLDADMMAAITARFLDDAITRCQALREAAASGDPTTVEHIGHYIKGGAAQLAIPNVRDLGAALEMLGRDGHLGPAAGLVGLLEEAIASARARLNASAAVEI